MTPYENYEPFNYRPLAVGVIALLALIYAIIKMYSFASGEPHLSRDFALLAAASGGLLAVVLHFMVIPLTEYFLGWPKDKLEEG